VGFNGNEWKSLAMELRRVISCNGTAPRFEMTQSRQQNTTI
jgi:hypothetical protein